MTDTARNERLALLIDPRGACEPFWQRCPDTHFVFAEEGHEHLGYVPDFDAPGTFHVCPHCQGRKYIPIDFTSPEGFWPLWEWFNSEHMFDCAGCWNGVDILFGRAGLNGYTSADFRKEAVELIDRAVFGKESDGE